MVDNGTATAAGTIITTSIMANTWITKRNPGRGRRLQEAREGRTLFFFFFLCVIFVFPVSESMPHLSGELA